MDDLSKIHDLDKQIAVLQEALRNSNAARQLQATEYERRLTELNHAHQQQMERNAQYVPREAWELRTKEVDQWRRSIDQWRWISIGAGLAGGGVAAMIIQMITGGE